MSQADCLLSVDIGTESARAALIGFDGRVLASSSREYDLICPRPGWAEQEPESWWKAVVANIREALAMAPEARIAAVGVCGQMHATVAVDKRGELVSRSALLWCDKRSAPQCASVSSAVDPAETLRITGNPIVPTWTGFKLRWIRDNQPEVYSRADKFLHCKDYLNLRLTGASYTDYSEASGTYLFDARRRAWSRDLCELLGIDMRKLPPILDASQVAGHVTPEAAGVTGLRAGTPVVCGGGDMMCLLLGAGIARLGLACDITGTAADISVYTAEPLYDARLMHLHHVVPAGGWISFGILDAGGGSYRWFRDALGGANATYETLDRQAGQTPAGAEGLFFFPYLLGERVLGSADSRGVFFGFTPRHHAGHCVRAIMEGVSYDLRMSLEIIEAAGVPIQEIRAIGGGARSPLWCGIKADIYGKPITTLRNFEGGVVGAAILAGLGAGVYPDVTAAVAALVETGCGYAPDPARLSYYGRCYRLYKSLHDGFQPFYKEVAALSQFDAAV
jgi:xylulokinase